jgi:hypothetical protein
MICLDNNPDRLYDLVPVVYRLRDADQGYPLKALLRVISEQVNLIERDIAGLYENWFIETCADWVIPYIGTLLDYVPVHAAGEPTAGGTAATEVRNRILFPRREMANTVRFRRRKGTLRALEDIAAAASGWPVRAVEIYRQLGFTQNIAYQHLNRGRIADLRDVDSFDRLAGAFNETPRSIDIRQGGWNLPQVRLFVWRLRSYSVTRTQALHYEDGYLFNSLGIDTQLFLRPQPTDGSPGPLNVPQPIARRDLESFEPDERRNAQSGVRFFYGPQNSFAIWVGDPPQLVPADQIVSADLSDWSYRPTQKQVAVDPILGRIAFSPTQARKHNVLVSYNYGFSADMGGGEYRRDLRQPADANFYYVGVDQHSRHIGDALTQWQKDQPASAVIEITDSAVYAEPIQIELAANQQLILRASNGHRPVIRLTSPDDDAAHSFALSGKAGSWFTLDGIIVSRGEILIEGEMAGVVIRHSTLVPGLAVACNCEPKRPDEPSIELNGDVGCLRIEHGITGAIRDNRDQAASDPLNIRITDSILDATDPTNPAIGAPQNLCAHAILQIARSTVYGRLEVRAIELAENCILLGAILVCRRQQGCIRFCYVTPGSRTPRRYECQPDLVEAAVRARFAKGTMTVQQRDLLLASERLRVEPEFQSVRYGDRGYSKLTDTCAVEIRRGAEDESEVGAFHDLFGPQRAANLEARVAEFTPAGAEAGIQYVS